MRVACATWGVDGVVMVRDVVCECKTEEGWGSLWSFCRCHTHCGG